MRPKTRRRWFRNCKRGRRDCNQNVTVKALYDRDATKSNIKAVFDELSTSVKATDTFVLYMAGHGKYATGTTCSCPLI